MILSSVLRAYSYKGQWQVPEWWPSTGKGLMDLMHINGLGLRHLFTL